MGKLVAVCSAKTRTDGAPNGKRAAAWWKRDVYHIAHSGITTMCGRDRSEWLVIGSLAEIDSHCCAKCAKKVSAGWQSS